jgi:uncharacterized protein
MIVVDVNLLLYAVVTGFPQHERARSWWESVLNDRDEVGLSSPSLFGFLRIVTNPRILEQPLHIGEALTFVQQWLARPNVGYLVPGPRHLAIAFALLEDLGTGGNLTTDVQLAALALENDGEVHSSDADFGRFAGLRWVNPLR